MVLRARYTPVGQSRRGICRHPDCQTPHPVRGGAVGNDGWRDLVARDQLLEPRRLLDRSVPPADIGLDRLSPVVVFREEHLEVGQGCGGVAPEDTHEVRGVLGQLEVRVDLGIAADRSATRLALSP